MSEQRVWLVERSYNDKGLVSLVYATPDGNRHLNAERSAAMLRQTSVTAAKDVDADRLEPVEDPATVERYATEAARMADRHDPDEAV